MVNCLGHTVELVPGGARRVVTPDTAAQYLRLAIDAYTNPFADQVRPPIGVLVCHVLSTHTQEGMLRVRVVS